MTYVLPTVSARPDLEPKTVWLVANGDLRPRANAAGWATQVELEEALTSAFAELGWSTRRAHGFDPAKGHGFIDSQRMGLSVFTRIPPDAPLVVAEGVWQYSHHVLAGLRSHPRTYPYGGQFRREMARFGRPAQPQRQPDEDGQGLLVDLERRFHRPLVP